MYQICALVLCLRPRFTGDRIVSLRIGLRAAIYTWRRGSPRFLLSAASARGFSELEFDFDEAFDRVLNKVFAKLTIVTHTQAYSLIEGKHQCIVDGEYIASDW